MTESYDDWAGRRDEPRFTDWLGARAEPHWSGATGHRFTRELAGDALADAVFVRYLVQDYVFIDALASLVGFAVGHAPGCRRRPGSRASSRS
jgi:thiaminase/transcriptional activator TenA